MVNEQKAKMLTSTSRNVLLSEVINSSHVKHNMLSKKY